ncbi:MAG TPA: class I tRNA ligase family protein [Solirubrobacteraceae bacterium]|nr:class I tRNA ligase family protein [Solirubrobacteraceae bacterium]
MNEQLSKRYDPQTIEARRQAAWRAGGAFRTPSVAEGQPRKYIKPSAPFTSGNIHIGHVRSYSIGDAYARFCRARGDAVLFAFGFDAFGLPAELGAIAGGESPSDWVSRCATHMTGQLERLGFSFDWERSFLSSDALMYRWSQWLFLTLLAHDLIYRGTGSVDWCEHCQTTLATIQVENGLCWRCHNPVQLIQRTQWYLRISAHVAENDLRLQELADSGIWDESSLASQRFVLGRLDGVELELSAPDGAELTVFTPHSDSLSEARFVAISPKHPDVERWVADLAVLEQLEELRSGGLQRDSRDADAIPLIDTGHFLPGPVDGRPLPVLISPVVDGRFGPTAVLGMPELDRTDAVIAQRLSADDAVEESTDGRLGVEGAPENGQPAPRQAVRYRANDFSISRQRSWGTPIPIVHCEQCGAVPVPIEQLPVLLPLDLKPTGAGNPLAEREDFVRVDCPRCGGPARRETDTLDCHFDALWLWIPACVPASERERPLDEIFALEELRRWLPSERLVAGSDSGNFVFDQRIVTKALRDIGPLSFLADGEPFAGCLFHEMVIRDGRKMSKHLGNVVDPDELLAKYGADTVRLATLYAARPQRSLNWSDSAVLRCHRFLTQVWEYSLTRADLRSVADSSSDPGAGDDGATHDTETEVRDTTEHLRLRLEKWCGTAVEKITEELESLEMHSAVRNVMRLFDRIKDFEKRVLARQGELSRADSEALLDALTLLIQLLGPFAPHLSEELWIAFGHEERGAQTPWPGVSSLLPA